MDGACAGCGSRRGDGRPGVSAQHAARQPARRGRRNRGDLVTPDREQCGAQAQARRTDATGHAVGSRSRGNGMSEMRRLDTRAADFEREFAQLNAIESATDPAIEQAVESILADVRTRGDAALLEYTARFDLLRAN